MSGTVTTGNIRNVLANLTISDDDSYVFRGTVHNEHMYFENTHASPTLEVCCAVKTIILHETVYFVSARLLPRRLMSSSGFAESSMTAMPLGYSSHPNVTSA
jgi:hypothetical protein